MRVCVIMRNKEEYPYDVVRNGLLKNGFTFTTPNELNEDDLLITWTPWQNSLAHKVGEHHKGRWLVMENGYISSIKGETYYAIGNRGYNGNESSLNNFDRLLDIKLENRPECSNYILIIAQFGHRDIRYSMPVRWLDDIITSLRKTTCQRIIIRPKFERRFNLSTNHVRVTIDNNTELTSQIEKASTVVTWNSPSVSALTLTMGVPLYINSPISFFKEWSINKNEVGDYGLETSTQNLIKKISNAQFSAHEVETTDLLKRMALD